MTNQQPRRSQKNKNAANSGLPNKTQPLPKPEGDTPTGKFNNAMRKILSVSKKRPKTEVRPLGFFAHRACVRIVD